MLSNAWRLMSRSGKNLIQIRGHRAITRQTSKFIFVSYFRFFSRLILSYVFYFQIFFHFFEFQSFTQNLISLGALSFDHDFNQFSDRHFSFHFFRKYFLKFIQRSNLKTFQTFLVFFHFSSFKLKSSLQSEISVSVRLKEWQEWIANKRTITP